MDLDRHLTENEIAGYLGRDLTSAERRWVEAHLDACADCRAELAAVHDLVRDRRPGRSRWLRWAIPAGLAAAVGGLALIESIRPNSEPTPLERPGLTPTEAAPPLVPVAPVEGALLPTSEATFVWHHLPAETYRFTLLTADGAPLWTAETGDTAVTLPPEVVLDRANGYFWRVDAIRDGVLATTGVVRFTVVR